MKLFVLVKVFELLVEDVDVFKDKKGALRAFKQWTYGLTPGQLAKREERNSEEKYSQTQIFEVEMDTSGKSLSGNWQCDRCLKMFDIIEKFDKHTKISKACRDASAVR